MGTRHLIAVIKDEKPIVAQYGQWDGYPEGQGACVLDFLGSKELFNSFKKNLNKVRFMDERDEPLVERLNNKEATENDKQWFRDFYSRDLGADVLFNIAKHDGEEIVLSDSYEFGKDTVFCEWVYTINLDNNTLTIQQDLVSDPMKVYDLSDLPSNGQFVSDFYEE